MRRTANNPADEKYVVEALLEAVTTMRRFLDDAEQAAKRDHQTLLEKAVQVLHNLVWGYANASTRIEKAIMTIDDLIVREQEQ